MLSDTLLRSATGLNGKASQRGEADPHVQLEQDNKVALFFLLFVLAAGGVLAALTILFAGPAFRILHVAGFLLLGYLQVRLFVGALHFLNEKRKFIYTIVPSAILLLCLTGIHFLFPSYGWLPVFSAISAFALPYTLGQVWRFYEALSAGVDKTWSYSDDLPLQKSTTFLNSMPVKFKIILEDGGELQYQVSFRAPVRMKLGLIFYHMVQSQQTSGGLPISLVNASNEPFQWAFQTSQFGFQRNLDPDAGLIENGIRQNMLVVARRLKQA